ncbi:nucleotidyltransferase family protein [Lentibacter sp.]|uniref:nucleotidyltransferase family protein n=1 Tax=Lentibacter sp. TaxID=2024994 RepID=UPI003F6BAF8C
MSLRAVLLPAAGASSRMRGRDKLLEDVHGTPCLRHMAKAARASADLVFVTLPSADHPRADALAGLDVRVLIVADAATGMSASLKAGAKAAISARADALMVLPADMPDLSQDLAHIWQAYEALPEGHSLRACTESGDEGHPVVFAAQTLPDFQALDGDRGAEPILQQNAASLHRLALPAERARRDLNTPEDWAQWRRSTPQAE